MKALIIGSNERKAGSTSADNDEIFLNMMKDGEKHCITALSRSRLFGFKMLANEIHRTCTGMKGDNSPNGGNDSRVNILFPWPSHKVSYKGLENDFLNPLLLSWTAFIGRLKYIEFEEGEVEVESNIPVSVYDKGEKLDTFYFKKTKDIGDWMLFHRALYFQFAAWTRTEVPDKFEAGLQASYADRYWYAFVFHSGSGEATLMNIPRKNWDFLADGTVVQQDFDFREFPEGSNWVRYVDFVEGLDEIWFYLDDQEC